MKKLVIYLDESYDQPAKRFILLGLLFCPSRKLHRFLGDVHNKNRCLDKHKNIIETKYNNCFTKHNYTVCIKFIDAFFRSDSWFCSIIVDTKTTNFDLDYFGKSHESKAIKEARVYKKFTELILSKNTKRITNAVLLVDEVKRCNHDRFVELLRESFSVVGEYYSREKEHPTLRHISSVKSDKPEHVRLCLCDLLLGCVLNQNLPTRNRWKNSIRKYLVGKLNVKNLKDITWQKSLPVGRKFRLWYWKPEIKKA